MAPHRARWVVIGVCLVASGAVVVPQSRSVLRELVRPDPRCPLGRWIKSLDRRVRLFYAERRLRKASRVVREDARGYALWQTPKGDFWISADSGYLLAGLLAEQETRIYEQWGVGVRQGDVVLDCGAHVGIYTREALARGAGLVVAIEPDPENLECLRRNLAPEIRAGRVFVCPKGVWDREDQAPLDRRAGNSGETRISVNVEGRVAADKVELTTIDRLVRELKLARVDFIKMDIEGAEQRALAGARATLAKYKPRLAIAGYHLPDNPEKLPPLVFSARADYALECDCAGLRQGLIQPKLFFFH